MNTETPKQPRSWIDYVVPSRLGTADLDHFALHRKIMEKKASDAQKNNAALLAVHHATAIVIDSSQLSSNILGRRSTQPKSPRRTSDSHEPCPRHTVRLTVPAAMHRRSSSFRSSPHSAR